MIIFSKTLRYLRIFTLSATITIGVLTMSISPSHAQSDAGCAGDTWTAMVNQAALQSRREDLMNKTYIVKADSVLQYSCFQDELDLVVAETGQIFSNGDHWANDREVRLIRGESTTVDIYRPLPTELHIPTDPPTHYELVDGEGYDYRADPRQYNLVALTPITLENAVSDVVEAAYNTYINSNFNHTALSNTTSYRGDGPASLCYSMAEVWRAAKCKNFDGPVVFYSLEELDGIANIATSDDPRIFPPEMACDS